MIWGGAVALAIGLAFYAVLRPAAPPPVPETAEVELGDLTVELPATGSIDAVNVIDVGTVVSGRIESLHVDFNDRVRAGQLLAKIEDDDYRADHLQAQADLVAARAAVEAAVANLQSAQSEQARATAVADRARTLDENSRTEWERNQRLHQAGIVSQAVMDRMQTSYVSARADANSAAALAEQAGARVKSAAAVVEQARAMERQRTARAVLAKRNLDYCRITSPVGGVIVSRNVDAGQTVAARLSAPSLFHIAEDLSHMYVYAKLDSSDVGKVRQGLSASFTVNAFPGETFEGRLIQVRINANAENPVARAVNPVGQMKRTIAAAVTVASTAGAEMGASSAAASAGAGAATGGGAAAGSASSSGSSSAMPAQGTRNIVAVYDALIEFRNPEEKLLPGMTAYVTIPLGSVQDALKVPNAALRFSPDVPDEQRLRLLDAAGLGKAANVVWVVSAQRDYRPVGVKPVLTDFVFTAVESRELKPGMRVATRVPSAKGSN